MEHLNSFDFAITSCKDPNDALSLEMKIPKVVSENFGNILEIIREERELTRQEFYEILKISKSHYSEIINKKTIPNLLTIEKICYNLNIQLYSLIFKIMLKYEDNATKKQFLKQIKPILDDIDQMLELDEVEQSLIISN